MNIHPSLLIETSLINSRGLLRQLGGEWGLVFFVVRFACAGLAALLREIGSKAVKAGWIATLAPVLNLALAIAVIPTSAAFRIPRFVPPFAVRSPNIAGAIYYLSSIWEAHLTLGLRLGLYSSYKLGNHQQLGLSEAYLVLLNSIRRCTYGVRDELRCGPRAAECACLTTQIELSGRMENFGANNLQQMQTI